MPPLGIARFERTNRFKKAYKKLSNSAREGTNAAIAELLLEELPNSRNLEPIKRKKGIWSIRINYHYRMSFELKDDTAIMRNVAPHDKLYANP